MDALDEILKRRKTPDVPSDLSARIIAAAHRHDQEVVGGAQAAPKARARRPLFDEIFGGFVLPKPAFALAMIVLLVIGIGLGVEFTGKIGNGMDTEEFANYLSIEDSFKAGDWV